MGLSRTDPGMGIKKEERKVFEAVIWGIYAFGFIGVICIACAISDHMEKRSKK